LQSAVLASFAETLHAACRAFRTALARVRSQEDRRELRPSGCREPCHIRARDKSAIVSPILPDLLDQLPPGRRLPVNALQAGDAAAPASKGIAMKLKLRSRPDLCKSLQNPCISNAEECRKLQNSHLCIF
jgi:hypothetical protein